MTQKQMNEILNIGIELTSEQDIHSLLEKILSTVMSYANCDAGTIYLKDGEFLKFAIMRNNTLGTYAGGKGEEIDIPAVPIDREHVSSLALIEDKTIKIADVYDDSIENVLKGPRHYDKVTNYHTQSVIVVPMKNSKAERIGVLQLINALDKDGNIIEFSEDLIIAIESIASQAAVAISNAQYLKDNQEMFRSFVETMVAAIGTLTPYNENHTRNMVTYGDRFIKYLEGTEYALSKESAKQLIMSIWLHDLGKLVTPISIMNKNTRLWPSQKKDILHRMETFKLKADLFKLKGKMSEVEVSDVYNKAEELLEFIEIADDRPFDNREEMLERIKSWKFADEDGNEISYLDKDEIHQMSEPKRTLTKDEFKIMQGHVVQTDKLLSSINFPTDMPYVRSWAASHHEFLNGEGYPLHLTAESIPTEVRILTILDIFEALTAADRDYKKPKTPEVVVDILKENAARGQLDAALVDLFEKSECWK